MQRRQTQTVVIEAAWLVRDHQLLTLDEAAIKTSNIEYLYKTSAQRFREKG